MCINFGLFDLPCSIFRCLDGVAEVLFVLTGVDYKSNCICSWD